MSDVMRILSAIEHGDSHGAAQLLPLVYDECLAIGEKQEPGDWRTFNTQSMLGGARMLEGCEGMQSREQTIPKTGGAERRMPEALDRLVELYAALEKPDELKKWQAEWANYPETKPTKSKDPAP